MSNHINQVIVDLFRSSEFFIKTLVKQTVITAYCYGVLSFKNTDKIFNKFRLGGV